VSIARFSVFLIVLSSFLIAKGYQLVFFGSLIVFFIALLRRKFIFDFFTFSMLVNSFVLFLFLLREVSAGSLYSDYFISSLMMALSYMFILSSSRFNDVELKLLLKGFQISLVLQAVIIYLRFTGIFEFPIPFGESEGNYGMVSLQSREQISAVSMCLQVSAVLFLSTSYKAKLISVFSAIVSVPAVLLTGSTLAFGVFFLACTYLFIGVLKHASFIFKSTLLVGGLVGVITLSPFIADRISEQYLDSASGKFEAVSVIRQLQDGELLKYKVIESNSRVALLVDSISFVSNNSISILSGRTREDFIKYTGGLSPHSILSELIALGGVIVLLLFTLFIGLCYLKRNKSVSFYHYGFFLILILFTGTINSINMGIPMLGLITVLMRRPGKPP
jgi:hypothetical protein